MTSWEDRLKCLHSESQRFVEYLNGLSDDAWTKQSACDLWQVHDVVAHLIGNAEFYAGTVERGLKGEYEPLKESTEGVNPSCSERATERATEQSNCHTVRAMEPMIAI